MASSISDSSEASFNDRFFDYFKQETTTLQEQIERLSQIPSTGTARLDAVTETLAGIAKLQREVSDALSQLPAHNQKTYSDQIKQLNEKLQRAREAFAPRQKFSFKNARKITSAAAAPTLTASETQPPAITSSQSSPPLQEGSSDGGDYNLALRSSTCTLIRRPSFTHAASLNISSQESLHIIVPHTVKNAITTSTLHNISRCIIDISLLFRIPSLFFATMNITKISDSLIVTGKVKGALHITDMKDSVVVASSGQLRMHQCQNVLVYLYCSSDPIIEHCKGVKFAPLPDLFSRNGKDEGESANRWNQVQDFQWIKAEHSPNWSELHTDNRAADSVWRDVVSGDEGMGVDEILQKVRGA